MLAEQTWAEVANVNTILIDGVWEPASEWMSIINPYTSNTVAKVACSQSDHVRRAVSSARQAFEKNRHQPSCERADLLRRTAACVESKLEEFAETISAETGKPISAAKKEVRRCVNTLNLSAEEATRIAGETISFDSFPGGEQRSGYYIYEPLGVIVAITPFNDPLNLVAHKLGPALAAGNSVVLKPSEQAPLSAIKLVQAFIDCGLPAGQVSVLTGYGSEFGSELVASKDVAMVSYTGGEAVGEIIAREAGIKKLAMELGANSPVIVMDDCDVEQAADACVSGSYWAVGQNCIGVQRIYVHRNVYDKFREAFRRKTEQLVVGDPFLESTDVGPMVNEQEAKRIESWVQKALDRNAVLIAGGKRQGAFYYPTALENVPVDAELVCREAFGPVVSLFEFDELDTAIAEANQLEFSIHAAIFTSNIHTAMRVSRELEVAGVMINDSTDYRLDAMPFGGAKRGSMGREGVHFSVREMVQTKVVCMNLGL